MHPIKTIRAVFLAAPLLFCASCDSPTKQPAEPPSAIDEDPIVKRAPSPTEEPAEPAEPAEPDWKAKYESLKPALNQSFSAPRIGQPVTVKLKSGAERRGTLTALGDHEVTLALEVGEVSYPRVALSATTRAALFADDYAHVRASERVRSERKAYQRKNEPPSTPAKAAPASTAPVNDPGDQSVWQVKDYLKATLKDPETIRYQSWSPVMKTAKGYQVVCTYQVRAGSFGMVTEKKVFHLTHSGEVTTASAVRRDLEK